MPPATARLRWGILGVANNNKRVLPAFAKSTHAYLCAIASRSLERAQSAAAAAGIPTAYGSYERLRGARQARPLRKSLWPAPPQRPRK